MATSDSESDQLSSIYSSGSNEESDYEEVSHQSVAWDHFTKVISVGGEKQAQCNHCQKVFKVFSDGNDFETFRLKKHLDEDCENYYGPQGGQKVRSSKKKFKFDQSKSRKSMVNACIKLKCILIVGEDDCFRALLKSLNPDFKVPSQRIIEVDVIAVYEEQKIIVNKLMDEVDCKVSLTSDMWTSDDSAVAFCSLTSHFIDDNWKLQKKTLAYKQIPFPDDELWFTCMKDVILEWDIAKKLCSVVVDNTATSDSVITKLKELTVHDSLIPFGGELLPVRCFAHILNLIVQDALDQIEGFTKKIHETAVYLNHSPNASQYFDQAKHQCGLNARWEVNIDMPNQWNSTFYLLEEALPLRKAFSRLHLMDKNYHFSLNPSDSEWEVAEGVLECLKFLYAASQHFSGGKYPTSNVFFYEICKIHLKLTEWRDSGMDSIRQMSGSMKERFDKYWDECSLSLAVAVVFDPRFKMHLVEYLYTKIYGSAANSYIQKVRDCIDDLFISYGGGVLSSKNEAAVTSSPSVEHDAGFSDFYRWCNESRAFVLKQKSELDIYLDEGIIFPATEAFNVLDWWKMHSPRLPILGKIARDILAIPATTVISEEAFKVRGRIIDERFLSLRPEVVEALVVANDWIE